MDPNRGFYVRNNDNSPRAPPAASQNASPAFSYTHSPQMNSPSQASQASPQLQSTLMGGASSHGRYSVTSWEHYEPGPEIQPTAPPVLQPSREVHRSVSAVSMVSQVSSISDVSNLSQVSEVSAMPPSSRTPSRIVHHPYVPHPRIPSPLSHSPEINLNMSRSQRKPNPGLGIIQEHSVPNSPSSPVAKAVQSPVASVPSSLLAGGGRAQPASTPTTKFKIPPPPAPPKPKIPPAPPPPRPNLEQMTIVEEEENVGLRRGKTGYSVVSTEYDPYAIRTSSSPRSTRAPRRQGTILSAISRSVSRAVAKTTYKPVDGGDENWNAGVDISFYDSTIPEGAIVKMKEKGGDENFAYTADGEAIDLSSFGGITAEDDTDEDFKSPHMGGGNGGMNGNGNDGKVKTDQSYYFAIKDPSKIPNWKPGTMSTLYLSILLILALGGLGLIEFLIWFAAKQGREANPPTRPFLLRFKDIEKEVDVATYSVWKYLPTLVAVIYGVLWELTDAQVKRVEPYFQLSRLPRGSLAESSLNVEYLTFWAVLTPLQAIRHKHWAVVMSSISSLLAVMAVPALQSAAITLEPKLGDRKETEWKWVTIHGVFSRILEAVLAVIAIGAICLLVTIKRRRSGLLGDPSGIAGVAAMANNAHILNDFNGLDLATEEEIHKALSKRTYILHKQALYQGELLSQQQQQQNRIVPKAQNPHPFMLRKVAGVPFIMYCFVMLLIIFLARFGPENVKNHFGNTMEKVPWLFTLLSTAIKSLWGVIDRDLRILEPFYMLHARHAHSDVLTMDLTSVVPGVFAVQQLLARRWLLALVGTATVLTEVLTVCIGSIDQESAEESQKSSTASWSIAAGILVLLMVASALVLRYRSKAFLPRQPGTIASVLAFIHQSNMLLDFSGTERDSTSVRRRKLREKGKHYGFGWYRGRDRKSHVGIDEEPILRDYVAGGGKGEVFVDGGMNAAPGTDYEIYDGRG